MVHASSIIIIIKFQNDTKEKNYQWIPEKKFSKKKKTVTKTLTDYIKSLNLRKDEGIQWHNAMEKHYQCQIKLTSWSNSSIHALLQEREECKMINDACQDEDQFKNDFEMISLFPNQYEGKNG